MDIWVILLCLLGLTILVVLAWFAIVLLEAAFGQWPEDFDDFDDADDIEISLRKRNYGD